jgi:hypothetical protein
MQTVAAALALALLATPILANPMPTPAPSPMEVERAIQKRTATCTFSGSAGYSSASKSKASCSTIILDTLTVPAGVTLDMTDLPDDTVVIFKGETSFAYEEWEGPLFAVSGTGIKVAGESSGGSILNGVSKLKSCFPFPVLFETTGYLDEKQCSSSLGNWFL